MAKITKDQIDKINAKCKNGFKLSLFAAVIHGEKQLEKDIQLGDSGIIYRFTLKFREECERFRGIGVYPVLDIDKLVPTGTATMYSVLNIGSEKLGDMVARRSIKALQDLTADYPDDKLISKVRGEVA